MRNWRIAGMDRPGFTASPEAAAWGAYATRFWDSPGCGMCFRPRRRLSRRERMAGECARVLSRPLVPSLIRSLPAEARITARVAENACDPQLTAAVPGRPMNRSDKLVVDDWCSAPMPAAGRFTSKESFTRPARPHVDDDRLNSPRRKLTREDECERYWLIIKPPLRVPCKELSWIVVSPSM